MVRRQVEIGSERKVVAGRDSRIVRGVCHQLCKLGRGCYEVWTFCTAVTASIVSCGKTRPVIVHCSDLIGI